MIPSWTISRQLNYENTALSCYENEFRYAAHNCIRTIPSNVMYSRSRVERNAAFRTLLWTPARDVLALKILRFIGQLRIIVALDREAWLAGSYSAGSKSCEISLFPAASFFGFRCPHLPKMRLDGRCGSRGSIPEPTNGCAKPPSQYVFYVLGTVV